MRRIAITMITLTLIAGACSSGEHGSPPEVEDPGRPNPPVGRVTRGSLVGFDDCDAMLEYAAAELPQRLSSSTYSIGGSWEGDVMLRAVDSAAPAEAGTIGAASSAGGSEEGTDHSGTNLQEAGIDEPDVVKTDGRSLFAVVNGTVQVVDLTGPEPRLAGSTALEGGWEHELLLEGDRLFVLGQGDDAAALDDDAQSAEDPFMGASPTTMVVEVDVSDVDDPQILSTRYVEGRYLTARVVDGVARLVVSTVAPPLDFVYPSGVGAEDAATEANREIILDSSPQEWLPRVLSSDGNGGWDAEPLVGCDQVSRPDEFSGPGTLTVISLDLGEPLDLTDAVSVMADGETVYASDSSLYVATNAWSEPVVFEPESDVDLQQVDSGYTSSIHKFDISEPGPARYAASGTVEGHLLNQFSMSEQDGFLRVAATSGSPWGSPEASESFVATFEERDGVLAHLGQVGDLGRGEQIHAVRFIGDQGYVVTFRQTDPLYVIDLSDPADPTLAGELEMPGYSAYLHPAGDGRLIGVGQAGTEDGQILGLQVSLFDVSDPADPTRIQQHSLGDGASSEAEWDHHAFLWWPQQDLAVLPVSSSVQGRWSSVAVGLEISDGGIGERGRMEHRPAADDGCGPVGEPPPDYQVEELFAESLVPCDVYEDPILRSVVVGEELLTISAGGLGINALETLANEGFIAWG